MLESVDHAICISLKHREDRRQRLQEEWDKLGLQVEYLLMDKDEEDPQRGCFHSHQKCAQLALDRGYNNILIFEDDVVFENNISTDQIARINQFISRNNPDLFYLGIILGKMWLTWHRGVARCRGAGTHGYVLSQKACRELITHKFTGLGIDTLYKRLFKGFCAFPMLCHQLPDGISSSDIDGFRCSNGKDQAFWEANRKRQYKEIFINLPKTLLNQ